MYSKMQTVSTLDENVLGRETQLAKPYTHVSNPYTISAKIKAHFHSDHITCNLADAFIQSDLQLI